MKNKFISLLMIALLAGCNNSSISSSNISSSSSVSNNVSESISSSSVSNSTDESLSSSSVSNSVSESTSSSSEVKELLTNERLNVLLDNTFNLKEVKVEHENFPSVSNNIYYCEENLIYELSDSNYEKYIYEDNGVINSLTRNYNSSSWNEEIITDEIDYSLGFYLKDKYNYDINSEPLETECVYGYFENKKGITFINKDNVMIDIFINDELNVLEGFLIHDESNNIIDQYVIKLGKVDYRINIDSIINEKKCLEGNPNLVNCTYTWTKDYTYMIAEGYCASCNDVFKEIVETTYKDGVVSASFTYQGFEEQSKNIVLGNLLTSSEVKEDIELLLEKGETNISIYLNEGTDKEMESSSTETYHYAIRSSLNKENIEDGSIELTIEGIDYIMDNFLSTNSIYKIEGEDFFVIEEPVVDKVKTINLLDATMINYGAFDGCSSLVTVNAPKVRLIKEKVFKDCTSLDSLITTSIENVNFHDEAFGLYKMPNSVNLILNSNKQEKVINTSFNNLEFESISYCCQNGELSHDIGDHISYLWSEDYSNASVGHKCNKCEYVEAIETVDALIVSKDGCTSFIAEFNSPVFETQVVDLGYTYDIESNTYIVYDASGLYAWARAVELDDTTNLLLMKEIELSTEEITIDSENGKPSGSNWMSIAMFDGIIDGNGYSIWNLRIVETEYENNACFINQSSDRAVIKNINFYNSYIYGITPYTSVIVGVLRGKMFNCNVYGGWVSGEKNGVGGLVGIYTPNLYTSIYACQNTARVSSTSNWVGGIVGIADSITEDISIVACSNSGEVNGTNKVGGIVGYADSKTSLIGCFTSYGVIGNSFNDSTSRDCYYVADNELDSFSSTTYVSSKEELNNKDVIDAMNSGIDSWSETQNNQIDYNWVAIDGNVPSLIIK